jgi:hypothetical protein
LENEEATSLSFKENHSRGKIQKGEAHMIKCVTRITQFACRGVS